MHAILVRSPLQSLPTAMNRPTTRRRSAKHAFDDEDAPTTTTKRAKTEVNGTGRKANGTGAARKARAAGELVLPSGSGNGGYAQVMGDYDTSGWQGPKSGLRQDIARVFGTGNAIAQKMRG